MRAPRQKDHEVRRADPAGPVRTPAPVDRTVCAAQLSRVHALLCDIHHAIVRQPDAQAMLSAACRSAVHRGGFRMAWIGMRDASSARLAIAAHAGASADTRAVVDALLAAEPPAGCVFTQRAMQSGAHAVCNDIARDPDAACWRAPALQRDYRALAALPLTKGGAVIGTFNLYAGERGVFDADALRLLDEAAADISFALAMHDRELERCRTEAALRESEERYRTTLDNIMEGCQLIGFDWRYLYLNDAAVAHSRRSRQELLGRTMLDVWPGFEATPVFAMLRRCLEERVALHQETEFVFPDGAVGWFDVRCQPVREGIFVLSIDITERRQAEVRIHHLNRVYAVLSDINQTIVRERDPQAILQAACRIAVDKGQFRMAWVGMLAGDTTQVVAVASAGAADDYLEKLRIDLADPVRSTGPTGLCLRRGEHIVCNDIEHDPFFAPWREAALRRGYRASAAFPLQADGKIVGALSLYAHEAGFFDQAELRLLDEMAMDIGFALEVHQREQSRQRAEAAMAEKTEVLEKIFDNAPMMICFIDQAGRIRLANPEMQRTFGWTLEEMQRHPDIFAEWFPDPARRAEVMAFIGAGTGRFAEFRVRVRDGRVITTSFANVLLSDGTSIGIGADVTERKRAEVALQESEERFRQLAENIQEVFWLTTPVKDAILYVSPAYEAIWGRTCASLYASPRTWTDAIHPDDRARAAQAAATKQVSGEYDEVYRITRPDGSVRWIRDRAFPIRNAAGEVHRIAGTAQDITRQMQLEEQVRQAQKLEAIGTLAGGIAHDFNNIIGAILGNAELARADLERGHPACESLEEIHKAGCRARSLVQRILAFGRQQPPERRPLALGPVIEEAVQLLRATLPAAVEITTAMAADVPNVLADTSQIHQILLNLGTNAWHALGDRPGRIEVKLESATVDAAAAAQLAGIRPGRFACLSVTDSGQGMDAATLARVFEPFFTTKEPGKGTGLGLPVVHGIVKEHDGAISVVSHPGQGTTVAVYLPALDAAVAGPAASAPVVRRGDGQRILYLDDEEPLVFLAERMLTRLGYRVSGFTNPAEALQAFRAEPGRFDLVITDLNMPGSSGLSVASEVLQIRPELPVVLTSGHITEDLQRQALGAGIRHVLYKPTTMEEFSQDIHRLVAETCAPAAARA